MRSTLRSQLRPANFTRGRLAAVICGGYLALVLAAWLLTVYDAAFVDHPDASLMGVYLIVLTIPSSFVFTAVLDMLHLLDPQNAVTQALVWTSMLLPGLFQAGLGWLVLRGRRVSAKNLPAGQPS